MHWTKKNIKTCWLKRLLSLQFWIDLCRFLPADNGASGMNDLENHHHSVPASRSLCSFITLCSWINSFYTLLFWEAKSLLQNIALCYSPTKLGKIPNKIFPLPALVEVLIPLEALSIHLTCSFLCSGSHFAVWNEIFKSFYSTKIALIHLMNLQSVPKLISIQGNTGSKCGKG